MSQRRGYGDGSITWLSPTKVRLRVRTDGVVKSKTVRVKNRDHGGRGEADAALEAWEAECNQTESLSPDASSWTLKSLMEDYIASRERVGKTKSTVENYHQIAKRLTPELESTRLLKLRGDDLDHFYGHLADKGLSPNTIRTTHAVLNAALAYAVQKDRIPSNPAARATPPDAKARAARDRITPAEVQKMIAAAMAQDDPVLAMAIFMAVYAGGRRGELCGLQWADFDGEAGTLRFERQLVPLEGGQHVAALKSNTGALDGVRTIYLGLQTIAVLERFRVRQRQELHREPDGWLLSYDGGHTPLRAKALSAAVTSLGRKCGLRVSIHSFRRTADTQLVAAGVDVDTASRRQGHTQEVMMRHYLEGTDDRAVAAATSLETRLIGQGLAIAELLA